jgi:hypothetical protein
VKADAIAQATAGRRRARSCRDPEHAGWIYPELAGANSLSPHTLGDVALNEACAKSASFEPRQSAAAGDGFGPPISRVLMP